MCALIRGYNNSGAAGYLMLKQWPLIALDPRA